MQLCTPNTQNLTGTEVGYWGRLNEEDVMDVLGGGFGSGGVLCRLG